MREIPLRSRKYPGLVALVDDEDYERVAQHPWWPKKEYKTGNFYARTRLTEGDRSETTMHRFVMRLLDVDHRDGDGLNNQKNNLRRATRGQQCQNRSKASALPYKGIRATGGQRNPWAAQIKVAGKNKHLGNFATPEAAARAYDSAAREAFGEFAKINFGGPGVQG